MASKVQIVSNAFLSLGGNTISSFDEGTEGKIATALYQNTYEGLLSAYRWRFAVVKHKLTRLAETPINEYQYIYQLPTDLLVVINTADNGDYELYEDKLYSNNLDVEIEYIKRVDETNLPAYFVLTLQFLLAAQFAIPLTDNTTKGQLYEGLYERQFARAKNIDGSSRPSTPIVSSPLTQL